MNYTVRTYTSGPSLIPFVLDLRQNSTAICLLLLYHYTLKRDSLAPDVSSALIASQQRSCQLFDVRNHADFESPTTTYNQPPTANRLPPNLLPPTYASTYSHEVYFLKPGAPSEPLRVHRRPPTIHHAAALSCEQSCSASNSLLLRPVRHAPASGFVPAIAAPFQERPIQRPRSQ